MKKLTLYMAFAVALITGCKKTDFDETINGEALGSFRLTAPATATSLVLNSATPTATVNITWTAAKAGVSKVPTYTWVAALKTGSLESPVLSIPSNNSGAATTLTLTQKQIDDALAAKSIAVGAKTDFIWSVVADNGSTKVQSQDVFTISITRMQDGTSPFILLGPASSSTNMEINPSSTTDEFKFNWTKSKPGNIANTVKYKVNFYKDDAASTFLFSMPSNNAGVDSLATISYKAMSDSLVKYGLTDFGTVANLKWNVTATSGNFSLVSSYTNQLYIVRLVRMYVVGSINGWNINAPLEIVADKSTGRLGKVFYTYMKLNAGDEFKFAKEPGNWGSCYGNNGVSGSGFNTGYNVGGNFSITTAGIYRLTVDLGNNKAYIQQKQVGLVGSLQSWNPASPVYGGLVAKDRFLIIGTTTATDAFKFHDGTDWDNSAPDKARYWGTTATAGLLVEPGGDITAGFAPRTRAIWDAADPQQIKYITNSAAEMRVVGDGINQAGVNDWDPASSPQMTYAGNGKWTISITLKANKDIKFLAGNAWGAFDYEDNSGQSNTTGTPRSIKWDGSNNFKTPATAGTYTITLDEYAQTVTIN
jgi:hypothetical protein